MTFPLLFEVGVHRYSLGPFDGYSSTAVYTPPRDSPGTPGKVYGWANTTSTEPAEFQGSIVVTDVELLAPPGFPVGPHDLVDLPDGQYEVIGHPEDYSHGPFGSRFGVVIHLRRVES